MSDPTTNDSRAQDRQEDAGSNASGSQADSAVTEDVVDSGQSEDIENSLTGQGISDRETTEET